MCPSLIEIGLKTAEKNSAQTNRQTDKQTDTTKIMVTWPWTKTTKANNTGTKWQKHKNKPKTEEKKAKREPTVNIKNCSCVRITVYNCRTQPSTEQFW